jgi:hypothetical protein
MNPRAHDAPSKGAHKKPGDSPDRLWSGRVTRTSNALDLEAGVFALDDPRKIARSLKRSAEASTRRKSDPFRSAMSMLTFYMNRAGSNLPEERRVVLDKAMGELRRLFGRSPER